MGCKCFDKSISGHMQSGGGNWLIDWWMVRGSDGRVKESTGTPRGELICRGKLLGRIWMRNVRMINEFFIKLVKVTGQVRGRGATARPVAVSPAIIVVAVVVALRVCVIQSHALNLPLSLALQRYPATHIDTCHLPHATYRTPRRLCDLVTRSTGGGFFYSPHEKWSAKQSVVDGKTKSNILLCQKGKTKFINWVKSLEDSPWQREQVAHAAWPWHWCAVSSGGSLITRLPPLQ